MTEQQERERIEREIAEEICKKSLAKPKWPSTDVWLRVLAQHIIDQELRLRRLEQINKTKN